MNDIFKIVKLKFKIFNTQFKINKLSTFLVFYGFIFSVLIAIQLFFIYFGQYEKMYIVKLQLLPIIFSDSIFPKYNFEEKSRIKSFFGSISQKAVDDFYTYKKYFLTILFMIYILFPYNFNYIKTALFCFLLWSLLYFIILILRIYFKIYNIFVIRILLILVIVYQLVSDKIIYSISYIADEINIIFYLILIGMICYFSLKLLNKFNDIYKSKGKYFKIFINKNINNFLGYNSLYLLRSGIFMKQIYIFYINYILFILNQKFDDANITFIVMIHIANFIFLYYIWKFEEDKFKILFSNEYNKKLVVLKYFDLLKIDLIYLLIVLPAIYYKVGILGFKLIFDSIIFIILFNLILFRFITKNEYRICEKNIKVGILIVIIFVTLQKIIL